MCGIAGVIEHNDAATLARKVSAMLDTIAHRGPDESRSIVDDNHAFGVVRLAIEAIDAGIQPIETDDFILGFNGEIFNYKALIERFALDRQVYDCEAKCLLKLFEIKGPEFVELIHGQFAIFIFNKRSRELHLYRDRFGIRPLFFHVDGSAFTFCSEMKGIFQGTGRRFEISARALAQTCMFWTVVGDQTAFEGIRQLRPGHYLRWQDGRIDETCYYREPLIAPPAPSGSTGPTRVLDALEASVRAQIHGEVGHACYLSGGVDSLAIAYFLTQNLDQQLTTYSVEFESEQYDESPFQRQAATHLNTRHKSIRVRQGDISTHFGRAVHHAETFLFRTAPVPLMLLSEKVRDDGFKVVITGEGADEILLGYDLFFENRIRRFWSRFPDSTSRPQLLRRLYSYLPQFKKSRYFAIIQQFYRSHLSETDSPFFSHLVRWNQFNQVAGYFNLDREAFSADALMEDLANELPSGMNDANVDAKAQILEYRTLLSNYLLSSQGDRMSMSNSVEGRYPYLGEDFVQAMAAIPPWEKSRGIRTKEKFRRELAAHLPEDLVSRPKVAYQAPEAKSFLRHDHRSAAADALSDNAQRLPLLNTKNLQGLEAKIQHEASSERLGFRENMGYILAQSYMELDSLRNRYSQ